MKKLLTALSVLAFLGFAGAANAEEASGRIAMADPGTSTLTLEDGTTFEVVEGVPLDGLAPGTEVTVSYEQQDGKNVATSIAPAQ